MWGLSSCILCSTSMILKGWESVDSSESRSKDTSLVFGWLGVESDAGGSTQNELGSGSISSLELLLLYNSRSEDSGFRAMALR